MKQKKIISFGNYFIDKEGNVKAPISWIVLNENDDEMFLLAEKILDWRCFNKEKINDWDQSDIKKWLNEEFINLAFSKEEQEQMKEIGKNEKVSLLSLDYYDYKYFPTYKYLKAEYTDYAKEKTKNIYGQVTSYKFGFWWLKTPNTNQPQSKNDPFNPNVYVYHICNNGYLNAYMLADGLNGVRPTILVKK